MYQSSHLTGGKKVNGCIQNVKLFLSQQGSLASFFPEFSCELPQLDLELGSFCQTHKHCFHLLFNFPLFLSLDDLPVIDTNSDLDESEEDVEKDSGQQISDCDSESFDEKPEALPRKPTNVSDLYLF